VTAPKRADVEPEPVDDAAPRPILVRRSALVLAAVAAVLLVVGTIGPPLVGRGAFLASDALSSAYPWRATQDPVEEAYAHHGEVGDTVDGVYPSRALFAESARDGHFLSWAPWAVGGTTLGGDGTAATLSPVQLLYIALPTWYAPAAIKLVQMAAAIGFTFLFCRRLGVDRLAAVFGGLAFAGSGFMVMWTNWPHPEVAALIPALFWATERFLQQPSARTAPPIALALGAMLLGNFPAIVFHALYVLAAYVLVRVAILHRDSLRRAVGALAGTGAATVAGVGLVAVVLIPFALRLEHVGADSRSQSPSLNLGLETLVTTVAPKALGLSTEGPEAPYFGRYVQIETIAFLGVTTVVLALAAMALPLARSAVRGPRATFAVATLVLGIATFLGGDLLGLLQHLPGFEESFIGRARAVLGFMVAVLGALGLQAVVDRRSPVGASQWARALAVMGAGVLVLTLALARARDLEQAAGLADAVGRALVLPVAIGITTVVVLLVVRFGSRRVADVAAGLVLVLLMVEALDLALPLLPNEDVSTVYPTTPGIDFLAANVGHDRLAVQDLTLFGSASGMYGLRHVTGHGFYSTTWKQAVAQVDPNAFSRSGTFGFLAGSPEVMTSPVLDRLGARWFAGTPGTLPPGERTTTSAGEATCNHTVDLADDLTVSVPADEGLRGLVLRVCEPARLPSAASIEVAVAGVSAPARTPLLEAVAPVELAVAIPAEDISGSGTAEVQLTLAGAGGTSLRLAATPRGALVADAVRPSDDGLRLVYADDLVVYERMDALPRIRWAGDAVVETDPNERLEMLAAGTIPDDTVLLSDDGPTGSGAPAETEIVLDAPTSIEVDIEADGDGYLVVADAMQHGWRAEIDGRSVDVASADHAGVAVPVPEGAHTVTLRYRPPGQRAGAAVSAVSVLGVTGAWLWGGLRARRARAHRADPPATVE
jgi:hypothetical protein